MRHMEFFCFFLPKWSMSNLILRTIIWGQITAEEHCWLKVPCLRFSFCDSTLENQCNQSLPLKKPALRRRMMCIQTVNLQLQYYLIIKVAFMKHFLWTMRFTYNHTAFFISVDLYTVAIQVVIFLLSLHISDLLWPQYLLRPLYLLPLLMF